MEEDSYPNFDTLCRLCLQPDTATVNIFPSNPTKVKGQLSIPVRIMACAALEVQATDGLPKAVCTECRYQLEKSYYFRKRCQLSDNRLKKHLRLLNLGKKSRIFSRTEEEDFEDELEFEDSLNFLKDIDAERQKKEQEKNECWQEWTKEVLREEIMSAFKKQMKSVCTKDSETEDRDIQELLACLREQIRQNLRTELRQEVKAELRDEVIQSVRDSLREEVRDECIKQAKIELVDEVRAECREEERENLFEELNDFLSYKRSSTRKEPSKDYRHSNCDDELLRSSLNVPVSRSSNGHGDKSDKADTPPPPRKVEKRPNDSLLTCEAQNIRLDIQTGSNRSDNEITSTEPTISFLAVPKQNDHGDDPDADTNFFILESDDVESGGHEDEQDDDTIFCYDGHVNYQIATSEPSDDGNTSYQIEANGGVQFLKKELIIEAEDHDESVADEPDDLSKNILIFDPDMEPEEETSEQDTELEEINKKTPFVDKVKTKLESVIKKTIIPPSDSINQQASASSMNRTNEISKSFLCHQCPRAFSSESSMLRHMTMHRILDKKGVSYQCTSCHITLSCKSALNRHMIKHTGRRPFACEECGKSFIQREILKRHLLTHSGIRPYECPHCERAFSQKLNLTQHVNKVHSENPKVQQYACHMCPKRFNHPSGLSRHLATHNGVAFQCTECERTFTDRSSVKRHIMHVHGFGSADKSPSKSTKKNSISMENSTN